MSRSHFMMAKNIKKGFKVTCFDHQKLIFLIDKLSWCLPNWWVLVDISFIIFVHKKKGQNCSSAWMPCHPCFLCKCGHKSFNSNVFRTYNIFNIDFIIPLDFYLRCLFCLSFFMFQGKLKNLETNINYFNVHKFFTHACIIY